MRTSARNALVAARSARRSSPASSVFRPLTVAYAGERTRLVASSRSPSNDQSPAIVAKLGSVQTGEQWDTEDGLELVFELEA